MSDKKTISISYERYQGESNDYCSHFSVIFETGSKFLIVFCKIDIGKKRGLMELTDHDEKFTSDMNLI